MVAVASLAGLLLTAPSASASIKVNWSSHGDLARIHEGLESLACPSEHLCLALTGDDRLALSRDPSVGTSWHLSGSRHVNSLSCTPRLCLVTMMRRKSLAVDLYVSTHPADGLPSFVRVIASGDFDYADAISCPTSSFCAGLDSTGASAGYSAGQRAWVSQSPGQPGSWHHMARPHNKVNTEYSNIVCTSPSLCLAYATNASTEWVAAIGEPMNPTSRWTYADADPRTGVTNEDCWSSACAGEQFTGGACAAPAECLLTTGYGAIVSSPNIQAATASWTRTIVYGSGIHRRGYYGLADPVCFSGSLCYMLGVRGDLLISTAPFSADPGAWQDFHIGQRPLPTVKQTLSCPSAQTCFVLASDARGHQSVLRGSVG
jgi:hypothetical protein